MSDKVNILSIEESEDALVKRDMVNLYEELTGLKFFDLLAELLQKNSSKELNQTS